jgi:hypothetical protein
MFGASRITFDEEKGVFVVMDQEEFFLQIKIQTK